MRSECTGAGSWRALSAWLGSWGFVLKTEVPEGVPVCIGESLSSSVEAGGATAVPSGPAAEIDSREVAALTQPVW